MIEVSECYRLRPVVQSETRDFDLEPVILLHFFNWMVKSFNFPIAAGYPQHRKVLIINCMCMDLSKPFRSECIALSVQLFSLVL